MQTMTLPRRAASETDDAPTTGELLVEAKFRLESARDYLRAVLAADPTIRTSEPYARLGAMQSTVADMKKNAAESLGHLRQALDAVLDAMEEVE